MHIRRKHSWELPESTATPEAVYLNRRDFAKGLAAGPVLLAFGAGVFAHADKAEAADADPSAKLYPFKRNETYKLDRALTPADLVTSYNNYYEFGSSKDIADAAQALPIRPWSVAIDGMVEKPVTIGFDDLLAKMPLEERLYRHRCVEAWSMTVPWSGFAMKALVAFAKPQSSAQYVQMTSFENPDVAEGQQANWYPWPYIEGLTVADQSPRLPRDGRQWQAGAEAERRAAAPGDALEIRFQIHQGHRALHLHRQAPDEFLVGHPGLRIRLLGQCKSRNPTSALEPGL
jgi:methionine sulfoxide reductase catalytic subunit